MIDYCRRVEHPVLWVEMRLGKTLVVVRSMPEDARRILVFAPTSALGSWCRELELEGEEYVLVTGTGDRRRKLLDSGSRWVLVNKECHRSVPELGLAWSWDAVVLDESASAIRYPQTQITRWFLGNFRDVGKRYVLAGRPDPQNTLLAYWPQMAWACGGSFMGCGSYWRFRGRYFVQAGYSWVPRRGAREKIQNAVAERAYVLRRKDARMDVPKVFEERFVELSRDAAARYRKAEERFVLDLADGSQKMTQWRVVQYSWLRQLAGGFVEGELVCARKMEELEGLINGELAGEQVVVWFAHNRELREAHRRLARTATWVDGSVAQDERIRRFGSFRSGDVRVLLLQVRIGDTGADLGAADTEIYYSLPGGVLSWSQSQDRILGDLTKKGVLVLSLLSSGTVDELHYKTLQSRDLKGVQFMDAVFEELRRKHDRRTQRERIAAARGV